MNINGSLKFDGSSASEIHNLRLQKVGALPAIASADVGRLIYNTATNIIHVGTNVGNTLSWVPLATGGDASALLAEVDRIESSLGLNPDGSFNAAAFTGNLADQTSYVGLITALQALAAANATAIGNETTRATAAEGTLRTDLATEVTDRGTAITTVTGLVTAETTRATGEEGRIEGLITTETGRATTAEGALGTRIDGIQTAAGADTTRIEGLISTETADRIAGDNALDGRIDEEALARETADTALDGRITGEATTARAAEEALGTRITTEVSDRTAAVNTVAGNLAGEVTRATEAETALGGRIDTEQSERATAIADLRTEVTGALVGLAWENPVDLIATDATTVDLAGLANGYRIVDNATKAIFTVTDGALGAGEPLVDGAAFFNRTNDVGYTYNGTSVVPFSGASSFVAGNGLVMSGNRVDVISTTGSITVTEDSIDVAQSVLTSISDNAAAVAAEVDRATTAETGLGERITDETTARTDALGAEATARTTAIQVEVDRALAAEAALGGRIDTTNGRIDSVEGTASSAVGIERDRAIAAETALGGRIDTEATDRAAAIAAETAARTGAATTERTRVDAALAAEIVARDDAILVETNRATAAEEAINTRVGSMYFLYNGTTASASHTVAHNIGQQYCSVTVVDATDNVVIPESVVFNSANELTVTFNTSIACRVVVMGLAAPAV